MAHGLRHIILGLAATAAAALALRSPEPPPQPTTVILVRHAEKADASSDPALSEAGRARAARLSAALRDARVQIVYASDRRRTQETAELAVKGWPGQAPPIKHYAATRPASELAALLRAEPAGSTILFVTHSNTVSPLLKELGGWDVAPLTESEYDRVLIVRLGDAEGGSLIRAGYPPP